MKVAMKSFQTRFSGILLLWSFAPLAVKCPCCNAELAPQAAKNHPPAHPNLPFLSFPFFSWGSNFCAVSYDCNPQRNSSAPEVFENGEMQCAACDEENRTFSATGTDHGAVKRSFTARTDKQTSEDPALLGYF